MFLDSLFNSENIKMTKIKKINIDWINYNLWFNTECLLWNEEVNKKRYQEYKNIFIIVHWNDSGVQEFKEREKMNGIQNL